MKASLLLLLMAVSGSASAIQEVNLRLDDGDAAEAGQDPASFTVTRTDDGNLAQGITAHVAVEGNASIGADYSYPGMNWIGGNQFWISIPGNQSFTTITLTPVLDNIIEDTEGAIITLLDKGSEYTVGADTQAEFSITDDVAEVTLTLDDGSAAEAGQDPASFTVTRTTNGNFGQGITAHVAVEGNASIGADYSYPGMNWIGGNQFWISIPGNQSFTTITLTPVLDNIIEDTEDAIITLLDKGSEYTVGADTQAEFSITDDVAEVTLTLDDGSAAEAGQDPASFTVTRTTNGNFGQGITAHVAVEGNASIGADYSYPGMNWIGGNQFWISIPGNQSFTTITLTPVLDNIIEDTEGAIITLLDKGSEYTVGADTQAEFSITDDVAEVTLTLDDGSAAEAGQDPASFTVTRTTNGNFGQGITAHVAVEGNASIGADYSYPGMNWIGGNQFWISIPGNQSFTTITLTPVLDNIIEDTEDAIITLLDKGSEYTVGADTQAEFSITDDVAEVTLTLDDGSAAEAGQDPASFTVTRTTNGNFGQGITAHVAVEGTATIGTDYSYPGMNWIGGNQFWISIPANQSSTKITLTPVVDNLEEEGDETIIVTLLDKAAEYTVGEPSIVSMTILDFQQIIFRDSFEE